MALQKCVLNCDWLANNQQQGRLGKGTHGIDVEELVQTGKEAECAIHVFCPTGDPLSRQMGQDTQGHAHTGHHRAGKGIRWNVVCCAFFLN